MAGERDRAQRIGGGQPVCGAAVSVSTRWEGLQVVADSLERETYAAYLRSFHRHRVQRPARRQRTPPPSMRRGWSPLSWPDRYRYAPAEIVGIVHVPPRHRVTPPDILADWYLPTL